jgi:hypothetical protein
MQRKGTALRPGYEPSRRLLDWPRPKLQTYFACPPEQISANRD